MIWELPQLQCVSHTQDLSSKQKRGFICFDEKAAGRGRTKRSSHHSQGVVVDSVPLSSVRLLASDALSYTKQA